MRHFQQIWLVLPLWRTYVSTHLQETSSKCAYVPSSNFSSAASMSAKYSLGFLVTAASATNQGRKPWHCSDRVCDFCLGPRKCSTRTHVKAQNGTLQHKCPRGRRPRIKTGCLRQKGPQGQLSSIKTRMLRQKCPRGQRPRTKMGRCDRSVHEDNCQA